jgi:hypothetical protein
MKVSGDHHRIKARGSWGGATQDDQTILTEDEQAGTRNEGMCANGAGNQRRLPRSIPGRRSTHFPFFFLVLSVRSQSRGHHVVELPTELRLWRLVTHGHTHVRLLHSREDRVVLERVQKGVFK